MFKTKLFLVCLAMLASQSLWAAQFARPDSTTSAGAWTVTGAATHHEALNEVTASDADYITTAADSTIILALSDVTDPGSYTSNHILRYRCKSTVTGNGGQPERCNAALYQGGTLIDDTGNNNATRDAFTLVEFTIPDASAITNYADLNVRLTGDMAANESVEISWFELEVPDAVTNTAPTVTTPTFTDITDTTATLGGNVTDDGGATVTTRGVEWGTTDGGPWPNSETAAAGGTGTFTVPVAGLPSSDVIYFRAWATNIEGTSYSVQNSFTTLPTVTTPTSADITDTTATLGGTVSATGDVAVDNRGVEWSLTSGGPYTSVPAGSGTGTFTVPVTGLTSSDVVYFRAWATNVGGTFYSGEASFTTKPTVTSPTFAGVTDTTATLGGTVAVGGGITVTGRGVVWDTASPPETAGTIVSMGSGSGTFAQLVGSLPPDTLIYFKAYGTNVQGTSYSGENSFTTNPTGVAPTVTSPTSADITDTTATLGGTMTNEGSPAVTDCGVEWGTSPGTYGTSQSFGTCTTNVPFTVGVTGLPAGTLIYYRAWADNGARGYSAEATFNTTAAPTVGSPTFADVTDTTATLGGTMTDEGFPTVTDCGVEWGTSPGTYPSSSSFGVCTENVAFTIGVTGLPADTTIYFRAWATNPTGTGYSAESSFATNGTPRAPTVTSPTFTAVTDTTATLGGTMTDEGSPAVTDCGVEWGTSPGTYGTSESFGACTVGVPFTVGVTGLPADTTIYFRAWAINPTDTGYSGESSFTTDPTAVAPTVTTPTFTGVTDTTATLGGTVTADGGATVTERGVVWNTTSPAESGGTTVAMGSGTGTFAQLVSGLPQGTLIYFKAYATNSAGTSYSTQDSFTTQVVPPTVDSPTFADVTADSATLGGTVSSDGGATVTARGIVWNTTSPPETGGTVVPIGSGLGTFSTSVGGLPEDTLVYFRAYATNSAGTAYSSIASFTTGSGAEPTVQVTNLQFTTIAGSSIRMTWTRGNGDGVIVVMRLAATGKVDPQDGDDYTGNPDFSAPPTQLNGGAGNFVVYKGPESSVLLTGLTQETGYAVAVYEYRGTGASTDYLLLSPQEGTPTTTNYAVHNYDFRVNCNDCHNHGSFGARGPELKAICSTCHNPSGLASAKLEFGFEEVPTTTGHVDPTKNPDIDVVDCGMCHELHSPGGVNTTESYNPETDTTQHNLSFLRANVDKYVKRDPLPDPRAAYLHTDSEGNNPDRAVEGGNDTTATGYCQVCHSHTNYHRSTDTVGANQCHDGASNDSCGPAEVNCGACHTHNDNFGASGGGSCTSCHSSTQGARPVITSQFDRASSHITAGSAAVVQEDCEVCHDQTGHPGDGLVGLLDADDGVTIFSQTVPDRDTLLDGALFEDNCMSCHDDGIASNLPTDGGAPTAGQTQSSPFTDSDAAPIIDATAWSSASHNSTSPPVTCVGNGANGCHGSGHGSEQIALLAPAPDSPAGSMTDFCFVCHDSDGPSSLDIQSEFAALAALNIGPVTSQGGATTIDNYHDTSIVFCNQCHSPHVNNDANPVADPDTDLPLATYNPNGSYTEDGATLSYNSGGNYDPLNPEGAPSGGLTAPDYIQFCLTCHDGTTPPGVTMAPNMINIASAYDGTDQHGSGDGSTGNKTSKGGLKSPWVNAANDAADNDPNQNYAAMNCTTCHGAHGTGSIYNLRESITVAGTVMTVGGVGGFLDEGSYNGSSTYTLPLIGGSQADHYWGAWCTFCHKGDSHPGKVEADSCTGAHMHGGGSF